MFEQVQLFQLLGYRPEVVEPVAELLAKRLAELPHPSARFDKIAICSGHMIDAPDRMTPRFPATKAEAVRAEIAQRLAQWGIGAGDLAVCGGACGADILFAEECLKRGAQIRLLLAQEVDDFVRDSVRHAGGDWVRRFHALREKGETSLAQVVRETGAGLPELVEEEFDAFLECGILAHGFPRRVAPTAPMRGSWPPVASGAASVRAVAAGAWRRRPPTWSIT